MQDMLELQLLFWIEDFVLLGDLKKAFLQIKLKSEKDKNCFCFFVKDGEKIRCFRYTTIIFGFISSPFMLNYILKYIADLYPQDKCNAMIKSKFFVDDLVHTANNIDELISLYKDCTKRMDDAHFYMRSCNSNNDSLRNLMKQDGRIVTHDSMYEKVLGYLYNPLEDTMQLKRVEIDSSANTKRSILAEALKVFDPLSVTIPVSVRCKTLISTLWGEKSTGNHWDEEVSGERCGEWNRLSLDLAGLSSVTFPRAALSSRFPVDFYLFTDASKKHMVMLCMLFKRVSQTLFLVR